MNLRRKTCLNAAAAIRPSGETRVACPSRDLGKFMNGNCFLKKTSFAGRSLRERGFPGGLVRRVSTRRHFWADGRKKPQIPREFIKFSLSLISGRESVQW